MPEQQTSNNGVPAKNAVPSDVTGDATAKATGATPAASAKPGPPRKNQATPMGRKKGSSGKSAGISASKPVAGGAGPAPRFVASPPKPAVPTANKPKPASAASPSKIGSPAKPVVAPPASERAKAGSVAKPAPGVKKVFPAARQPISTSMNTPAALIRKPAGQPAPAKPEAAKGPVAAAGTAKGVSGETPKALQQPTAPTPLTTDAANASLKAGISAAPTPGAIPLTESARDPQEAGKSAPRGSSERKPPATTATGAKTAGASAKPVAVPETMPGAASRESGGDTLETAAKEESFASPAVTVPTPGKPDAPTLAESGVVAGDPRTPLASPESKDPAARDEPRSNEPSIVDPAANASAFTKEQANPEPDPDGERTMPEVEVEVEVEVQALVEPAASREPVESSADARTPSADGNAEAAAGGTTMAFMVVSFILEVALLGALGIWAMTTLPFGPVVSVIIAVLPVLIFWALFMSPKANLRMPQPYHAVVAHLLFATGSGLLAIAGLPVLAVCMGVLTAISLALTVAIRGQNVESRKKATGRRAAR
jgi:hypothetical protein